MISHTSPAEPITPAPAKLLRSIAESAELISLSERMLWGLADCGDVPSVRVGGRVLIRATDLEAWVAAGCPHPQWTERQAAAKAARAASESEPTKKRSRASRRRPKK